LLRHQSEPAPQALPYLEGRIKSVSIPRKIADTTQNPEEFFQLDESTSGIFPPED
jgi:hypothetical protein